MAGGDGFWERSSLQLPEAKIESLWYMGLYLLASSSRESGASVSLHGLWQPDTAKCRLHWDSTSGTSIRSIGESMAQTTWNWGRRTTITDSQSCRVSKRKQRNSTDGKGFMFPGRWRLMAPGFWLRGRTCYSGPERALGWRRLSGGTTFSALMRISSRKKAYPFMRECMLFYEGFLKKEDDGKYHVHPTQSPEAGGWGRDDTLTLSLLRYLIKGLLEAVEILEVGRTASRNLVRDS